jgi:hypothetical protein
MTATPAIVALVATLALGAAAGVVFLQRLRRPLLVRAHLVAALTAGALVAIMAVTAPARQAGPPAILPVLLLAVAIGAGWSAKRIARGSRRAGELSLIAHLALGLAGFFVFLSLAKHL